MKLPTCYCPRFLSKKGVSIFFASSLLQATCVLVFPLETPVQRTKTHGRGKLVLILPFLKASCYHFLLFATGSLKRTRFITPGGNKLETLCLEEKFAVRRMKKKGWYFTAVTLTSPSLRISCKVNSHLFYTIYFFPQQQVAVKVHRVLPSFFGNSASARRFQFH